MTDRPYWCEICARKKECYGITLKPKCFVPTADRKTEPSVSEIPTSSKDEPQKRCDECIHFDKPYKKRDKDGMLIIGVECDGMDEPCDKWTDEPQTERSSE